MAELPQTTEGQVMALLERVLRLERLVQAQRRDYRDTAGTLRVRVGLQDDGKVGVRTWTSAGALAFDDTTS